MTKKALIDTNELAGQDDRGFPVIQVEDPTNIFDVCPAMEWKDCPDNYTAWAWWWDPATNSFRPIPWHGIEPTAEQMAVVDETKDAEGNYTQGYDFDWDTDTFYLVDL
jgi:hypothetical protein